MNTETRRRLYREYLWFALSLLALLVGSVIQKNANTAVRTDATAILNVGSAPH
jgi:hypothetical protein